MQSEWFPLWLSLRVAAIATLAAAPVALALAWILSRHEFRGKRILEAAVAVPLMFPATVLGFYLLVVLAQGTPLEALWQAVFGVPLLFTWRAAVVAALIHTTPLLVRSCRDAFEQLDPGYERAARSFGAGRGRILWSVVLPQIRRPLAAAVVLAFGRAMGDFGITLMIAGNVPGKTQTMPVAIYAAAVSGEGSKARLLALALSALLIGLMYGAARLDPRRALR